MVKRIQSVLLYLVILILGLMSVSEAQTSRKIPPGHNCYRWPFQEEAPPLKLRESILAKGYASAVAPPPTNPDGIHTDVGVGIIIEELEALNDVKKEVAITASVDVSWIDKRLEMTDDCKKSANITDCDDVFVQMIKTGDLDTLVYKPGVRIIYLKEVFERDFMYESDGYALINGCSGRITTHSSVRFMLSCSFDFKDYPFDQQRCELTFYAPTYDEYAKDEDAPEWAQSAGKLSLSWLSDPRIVQFKYGNNIKTSGNFDQSIVVQKRTQECEKCETHLKIVLLYDRVQIGYYVQTIVPSFLLVIASYGSLWVPSDQIPGRMALAVTTTLTLMGMINSVFQTSPDTAYLKAMDLWLIVCFFFTFLVLVEFCVVIALSRPNPLPNSVPRTSRKLCKRSSQTRDSDIRQRSSAKSGDVTDTDDDEDEVDKKFERRKKKQKHLAALIETSFKFILPIVHLLFLIIFFSCYAGKKSLEDEKGITYEPIKVLNVPI